MGVVMVIVMVDFEWESAGGEGRKEKTGRWMLRGNRDKEEEGEE